ncbi:hypothetical protein DL93DRAFT_1207509 [Clavulina sp. PMI_390]|nr:hypothetical protein DL93DRAFT_1207509 [Clavulina sp. PMI_390]
MERLPSELVAEILVWGVESLPTSRSRWLLQFRLAVSAVNVKWRAIALSTSRLWSLIVIDLYSRGSDIEMDQIQKLTEPVRAGIQRSANASLTIHVYTKRPQLAVVRTVWDIITPVFGRCRFLEIVGEYSILGEILPIQQSCPHLQQLQIYPIMQTHVPPPSLLFAPINTALESSPVSSAPILRKLVSTDVCQPSFLLSIPSSALLDVTILLPSIPNSITWECLMNFFLPCADTLEILHIDGAPFPPLPSDGAPIIFKRLNSFTTSSEFFPRYVVAPALDRLVCLGNSYRLSDKDVSPKWQVSSEMVSIQKLELDRSLAFGTQLDNWSPSSILLRISALSVPFKSGVLPLLGRMASGASSKRLFPQVTLLSVRTQPSSMSREEVERFVEAIVTLVRVRPVLKVDVIRYDGWSEFEASIPGDLIGRINSSK